jgi:ATP-dependent helicase HrpA
MQDLVPQAPVARRPFFHRRIALVAKTMRGGQLVSRRLREQLDRLERQLQQAVRTRRRRQRNLPRPSMDADLPITARRDEIIAAIRQHQVLIVSGETGSGKTTQLPQYCLAAGRGVDGQIACTQPRRIAAVTVAQRIAEELGEPHGKSVGYKIRFQDRSAGHNFIKVMTDGVLLAEARSDPRLSRYDTIIVDEAHERSLNIDFILGLLRRLLARRRDLKLIITSATIDTRKFSRAFDDAPVIEVSGRTFPVEIRYRPADGGDDDPGYVENAVAAVFELLAGRLGGDMLVFMPSEQDIRDTCELIRARQVANVTVLPLFARLTAVEQARVFAPLSGRKIIVATNVAETSITIPGIRYVVDTGLARISRYRPRRRSTSLRIQPVSRSSADQRSGRCGRVAEGVCVRLFSEEDYRSRQQYTPPEILRSNLAEVILRMMAHRLGDITDFPFVDAPADRHVADGLRLLAELGAISERKDSRGPKGFVLTRTGRLMAELPLDPQLSRMLVEAHRRRCLAQVAVIAAALSIQDPRQRPAEQARQADEARRAFQDPRSDFITWLNLWRAYHRSQQPENGSLISKSQARKRARRFCRAHFLSFKRMREWCDVHEQIRNILRDVKLVTDGDDARRRAIPPDLPLTDGFSPDYRRLHESILAGFLSQVAKREEGTRFKAAHGTTVWIFPGSALFKTPGEWIVAAEMVETTRLYARTCARIDPAWLEDVAGGLCRYSYADAHWDEKRGQVVATEKVSLFGLPIVAGRRVGYARVKPAEACDIFVRAALVEGAVSTKLSFMAHNRALIERIRDMESRLRRRDILIGDEELFTFYRQRLDGCCDLPSVKKRIRKAGGDDFLRLTEEELAQYRPDPGELALYPQQVSLGDRAFACEYRFRPGKADDGVTVRVPSNALDGLCADAADWLVPGLFREKVAALIRGLPKSFRRHLVPVADTVDIICREMPRQDRPLVNVLGEFIQHRFRVSVPAEAWRRQKLAPHLTMRFAVTGPSGETLREGRGREVLSGGAKVDLAGGIPADVRAKWEKSHLAGWEVGDIPEVLPVTTEKGAPWQVFPALEKDSRQEGRVNLRLFADRRRALDAHRKAVAVLAAGRLKREIAWLKRLLKLPPAVARAAARFGGSGNLRDGLHRALLSDLLEKDVRRREDFEALVRQAAVAMTPAAGDLLEAVCPVIVAYDRVEQTLVELQAANRFDAGIQELVARLRHRLCRLVPENFYRLYPPPRLKNLERYLKALETRARRAVVDPEKDRLRADRAAVFEAALGELLKTLSPQVSEEKKTALEAFYWMIEEFRVSLFAQELKTAVKVSPQRLQRRLDELRRMN